MTETDVSQQLWQMAQMFLAGWVMMLSAQQKQVLARRADGATGRRCWEIFCCVCCGLYCCG